MRCCKDREEGGTRERRGAKEESVGTTKEERGDAHGGGRDERERTPVSVRVKRSKRKEFPTKKLAHFHRIRIYRPPRRARSVV